jgi:glyoxylase-like metal-dependent hydrolase (beta-lactamase superfamily II)
MNENDLPLLEIMDQQAGWLGIKTPEVAAPDESLKDGLKVGLESYPAQVIHTPGHTQGSICLHFAPLKMVFAGDTLFAGSIGHTDLPGGNGRQLIDSIRTSLLVLPEETHVVPGHGPATTIGDERNSNPFLQQFSR